MSDAQQQDIDAGMRLAFLVSGNGSNLQAILDAMTRGEIRARAVGVVSNRPDVRALQRAAAAGVAHATIDHRAFADRSGFETAVDRQLRAWQPDLVVLAGFMRILGSHFVESWEGRLVNIHPSLLPAFPGLNTHQRALEAGHRWHGASIHYVTPELDGGPVIAQARVALYPGDDPESVAARVQRAEHRLYPRVLAELCSRRVHFENAKVTRDGRTQQAPEILEFDDQDPPQRLAPPP